MVDPKNRLMEMHSKNLTFNSYVNMEEKMTYTADPEDDTRTMLKQEMIVTVQGVPLTSYMEGIIVNTVSKNSSKGKAAIEWVVEKLGQECRFVVLALLFSINWTLFYYKFPILRTMYKVIEVKLFKIKNVKSVNYLESTELFG